MGTSLALSVPRQGSHSPFPFRSLACFPACSRGPRQGAAAAMMMFGEHDGRTGARVHDRIVVASYFGMYIQHGVYAVCWVCRQAHGYVYRPLRRRLCISASMAASPLTIQKDMNKRQDEVLRPQNVATRTKRTPSFRRYREKPRMETVQQHHSPDDPSTSIHTRIPAVARFQEQEDADRGSRKSSRVPSPILPNPIPAIHMNLVPCALDYPLSTVYPYP